MPVWGWLLEVIGALVVLLLLYGLALVVRRRVLSRHGGTFELSHRVPSKNPRRGWLLGLGRYSGDELQWFRIFTLSPRPKRTWQRSELTFVKSREPVGLERQMLYPGHVVIVCRGRDGELLLAMGAGSLTGFSSWLEAGPPGTDWSR